MSRIFESNSIRVLAVIIILFLLFLFRLHLAAQPPVDPDHPFNTARAFDRLERILGDETPHPVDSDVNDQVRARLIDEIQGLGFESIVRDDFHCGTWHGSARCARVQNVMFWIGEPGDNAVMVASHYDSVPAGPGASDDGAGVAASLEIAAVLKGQQLNRPVLVLITDGEEAGLIGATSFVESDPLAKYVKAVVSMEARGIGGPVAMFETSVPNGRDVQVLDGDVRTAITNSLLSDLYQAMPNGTDVTQYLKLGADATNYAYAMGAEFYHTPRDNLANLDQSSLFHMGANALHSVQAYQSLPPTGPEPSYIYSDLLGQAMIIIPEFLGLPLILLGGLAALFMVFRDKNSSTKNALIIPFIALAVGVGLAVALTALLSFLRPEQHFAAAHPWALRATQFAAALFGSVAVLIAFRKSLQDRAIIYASWFWLAVIGGAATIMFAGAAIIAAPALFIVFLSAVAGLLNKSLTAKILAGLAAILYLVIVLPITAAAEIMLFIEYSAPFTLFLVFALLFLLPLFLKAERLFENPRRFFVMGLTVLAGLVGLTIFVPAYSVNAPQSLNIRHIAGDAPGEAKWTIWKNNPIPAEMQTVTNFELKDVSWTDAQRFEAPAPDFTTDGIELELLWDVPENGDRRVTVKVSASDSDRVDMHFMDGDKVPLSARLLDHTINESPLKRIVCFGRSCREFDLELVVPGSSESFKIVATGLRFGLGSESQTLIDSRPDSALPVQTGDVRSVRTDLELSK